MRGGPKLSWAKRVRDALSDFVAPLSPSSDLRDTAAKIGGYRVPLTIAGVILLLMVEAWGLGLPGWALGLLLPVNIPLAYLLQEHLLSFIAHRTTVVYAGTDSTPYTPEHSAVQALIVRERYDEARAALERIIADDEGDTEARLLLADLLHRRVRDAGGAAEVYRAAQRAGLEQARDLFVSQRLIDLYLGPLDDKGSAMREFRRIMNRHPGTRAAQEADRLLREHKAELARDWEAQQR